MPRLTLPLLTACSAVKPRRTGRCRKKRGKRGTGTAGGGPSPAARYARRRPPSSRPAGPACLAVGPTKWRGDGGARPAPGAGKGGMGPSGRLRARSDALRRLRYADPSCPCAAAASPPAVRRGAFRSTGVRWSPAGRAHVPRAVGGNTQTRRGARCPPAAEVLTGRFRTGCPFLVGRVRAPPPHHPSRLRALLLAPSPVPPLPRWSRPPRGGAVRRGGAVARSRDGGAARLRRRGATPALPSPRPPAGPGGAARRGGGCRRSGTAAAIAPCRLRAAEGAASAGTAPTRSG